jgi:hypothetical protein
LLFPPLLSGDYVLGLFHKIMLPFVDRAHIYHCSSKKWHEIGCMYDVLIICNMGFISFLFITSFYCRLTTFCWLVPGVIGCMQALEAIKVATGVGEPLSGRMLLFDALSARIRIVSFSTFGLLLLMQPWPFSFPYCTVHSEMRYLLLVLPVPPVP